MGASTWSVLLGDLLDVRSSPMEEKKRERGGEKKEERGTFESTRLHCFIFRYLQAEDLIRREEGKGKKHLIRPAVHQGGLDHDRTAYSPRRSEETKEKRGGTGKAGPWRRKARYSYSKIASTAGTEKEKEGSTATFPLKTAPLDFNGYSEPINTRGEKKGKRRGRVAAFICRDWPGPASFR